VEAREALLAAPRVLARTATHPTLAALGVAAESFDALYESAEAAPPYARIAEELLALASAGEAVLYALPGDPSVAERTTQLLRVGAARGSLSFRLLPGLSCLEPVLAAVGADALAPSLWLGDALEVAPAGHPPFGAAQPALLLQLHSRAVASELKLTLMGAYPPEHRVCLVHAAGDSDQALQWLPLHQLDRGEAPLGARSSVYIPPRSELGAASWEAVCGGVARARDALEGPWAEGDPTAEGEAGELVAAAAEAAAAGSPAERRAALARLLLAVAVQAHVAADEGDWDAAELLAEAAARAEALCGVEGGRGGRAAPPAGRGYVLDEEEEEEEDGSLSQAD